MTSRTVDIHCKSCGKYFYSVLDVSDEDRKYVCKACSPAQMLTDWFPPHIKPVHVGEYEISFFDCSWQYEARAFWNGALWLDKEGGNSLIDQNQTWRGHLEQTT